MSTNLECISGADFKRMLAAAHRAFMREHEYINSLNVFPVPDGDTGTNMLLTLSAVAKAVAEAPEGGIGFLSKRAADSAIMGARGNSGVILSQIFRGIARGLTGKDTASSEAIGKAFQYGILYAYRAVAKPVEGTILTVAKGIAKGAHRAVRDKAPFAELLAEAIAAGEAELARTPELLPVLKDAGVVDAGGRGLITFLKGCLEGLGRGYTGPEADFDRALYVPGTVKAAKKDATHPYCTEFIVRETTVTVAAARSQLEQFGDSLVLAGGDQLLKVHIHTGHPGLVLETAITWGTLHDIKIDNMTDQHTQRTASVQDRQGLAVISVVSGAGLAAIMQKFGAQLIFGGQTMNPPVEDFIAAVHSGSAKEYIILPNNKNIILAAVQAKKLLGEKVEVLPTTSMAQGLAALVAFNASAGLAENMAAMQARIQSVR
ncbi:MAG: DAK2 domain-containing protein, partial [Negativicutes bacterium]|nr:DAK2 domain-containing protein [Negativicutes bacterium]